MRVTKRTLNRIKPFSRYKKDLDGRLSDYLRIIRGIAGRREGRAYIFGSHARGESIGASDVDVLIEIPDGVDRLEVLHEVRKI